MRAQLCRLLVIASMLAACAADARAQGNGALVVNTTPPGAQVSVDGKVVGRSPTSVYGLSAGDHLVEVKFPDGYSSTIVGSVIAGQSVVVKIDNPNAPPPAPAPAPKSAPPVDEEPEPAATAPARTAPRAESPPPSSAQPASQTASATVVRVHAQNRHRLGLSFAPGVACFLGTECTFRLRAALDFFIGDVHLNMLFGGALTAGALVGVELGSPYFQLGGKSSPVALAVRGSLELGGGAINFAGGGSLGVFLFTNTYGPNLSVMLTDKLALEARFGVGWYAAAANGSTIGFYFDSWVGLRIGL